MQQLRGAKVDWMLKWANAPTLELWLDGVSPDWNERVFDLIDGVAADEMSAEQTAIVGGAPFRSFNGKFLICRQESGIVSFVFESAHGGGALGGRFRLRDGTEYVTNGGWSSNPEAVNKLRAEDARFAAILPHPVMDASLFEDWKSDPEPGQGEQRFKKGYTAMAGHVDVPLAQEAIDRFLPGVALHEVRPGYWVVGLYDGRMKPDPSEDIANDERARVR